MIPCLIMLTAANVRSRQQLLLGAIGVFDEETSAYNFVATLEWALPLTVCIGAAVDALFVFLYLRFLHPWSDILFYQEKEKKIKVLKKRPWWSWRQLLWWFIPDDAS